MAKNVVVVGTQWGDEGKGKIVDWLTDHAQGVVRFQGGHNAGHTLVVGEKVYKLNQDSRRKLKQVYHLYHFIEPLLAESDTTGKAGGLRL